MQTIVEWFASSDLSRFVNETYWLWPICESLHFMALVLLVGTVSMFDLRVIGLAKGIPPASIHRLVPFGVLGFAVSAFTGTLFIFGAPDQYFYNSAFHFKVVFLLLMGLNVAFFYSKPFRAVRSLDAFADAPRIAKVSAVVSLVNMVGVMCCGRMLTFFRPTF